MYKSQALHFCEIPMHRIALRVDSGSTRKLLRNFLAQDDTLTLLSALAAGASPRPTNQLCILHLRRASPRPTASSPTPRRL